MVLFSLEEVRRVLGDEAAQKLNAEGQPSDDAKHYDFFGHLDRFCMIKEIMELTWAAAEKASLVEDVIKLRSIEDFKINMAHEIEVASTSSIRARVMAKAHSANPYFKDFLISIASQSGAGSNSIKVCDVAFPFILKVLPFADAAGQSSPCEGGGARVG